MKKFFRFIVVVSILIVASLYFRVGLCVYNAVNNKDLVLPTNSEGLILNQSKLNKFRFGVYSANKNCCGIIATYNFLKLNNKEADFKTILSLYDVFGSNVYGVLGVNPITIKNYLKLKGFDAKISVNVGEFNTLAKQSKISILVYLYKWGGHYIVLNYNEEQDNFITYNYIYGEEYNTTISSILNDDGVFSNLAMLIYCDDLF